MKQIGTITKIFDTHLVEVTVVRRSACAHDCEHCAGCGAQTANVTVRAQCPFAVALGDKVELYSDNRVLGYAALVYLVPLVLFFVGYCCPTGVTETVRYLCAGGGFALGIVLAVVCDRLLRRSRAVLHQILRKI